MNSRLLRFAPLFIFLAALAVRLVGLRWGLPTSTRWYSYHPDELQTVAAVAQLDFFGGDFNPNFFNYPSAFLYATYVAQLVGSMFGWTTDITRDNAIWALPHDIILCGRLISAILGALTASVVFLLGREIRGAKFGVLAGTLCALAPAHVQHSHFATVDIAATFWVALTLWLCARAFNEMEERHVARDFLLAALCAGIGAATKYNAVIVLVAPLVALWNIEYSISQKTKFSLGVVATAILGFLLGCPFSVLAPREFWGDGVNTGFAYELLVHPRQGSGDLFTNTGNAWWFHATFNLPFALTAPFAIAAILGFILTIEGVFKARKTGLGGYRVLVPLLAFVAIYFVSIGTSQVRFMRYILPLVPALAIFAALFCVAVFDAMNQKTATVKFAVALPLLMICAIGSANVIYPFMQTDARDAAKSWLDAQSESAPITVGLADVNNPLWFTTPPLWPQDTPPGTGRNLGNVQQDARYQLMPIGIDAAKLTREKPRYFVWSEFQWREGERLHDKNVADLRRVLNNEYSLTSFQVVAPFALPGRDYVPHDFLYSNPRVEVWKGK